MKKWASCPAGRIGVALVATAVLALWFVASCGETGDGSGPTGVAKSDLHGYVNIYLGQPGIDEWIPAIEADDPVPFHWTRIRVPDVLPAGTVGTATFDLAADCDVTVAQHFLEAPNCGSGDPVTYTFSACEATSTGYVQISRAADGTLSARFDFSFDRMMDSSCGVFHFTWGFSNDGVISEI